MKNYKWLLISYLFFFLFCTNNSFAVSYSWSSLADFQGMDRYSLFLKGNLRYFNSDIQGRVAVGGNATLKAFKIGEKAEKGKYSLVVGGKLHAGGKGKSEGGQVENGGIFSGRNMILKRVGLPKGDLVSGGKVKIREMTVESGSITAKKKVKLKNAYVHEDVTSGGAVELTDSTVSGTISTNTQVTIENPVEFEDIDLSKISGTFLANNNSAVSNDNGALFLECTDPLICYFDVTAKQIEDAWGLSIHAAYGKTVIINVKANHKKLTINDMAFKLLGGIRSTNILYNFYGFKKVIMHHIGFKGSILAPGATVNFYEGNMEGSLMAQNFIGGSWKNSINGGQINVPTPVPEPKIWILILTGLSIVVAICNIKKFSNIRPY